jgi:hypothetical protein
MSQESKPLKLVLALAISVPALMHELVNLRLRKNRILGRDAGRVDVELSTSASRTHVAFRGTIVT